MPTIISAIKLRIDDQEEIYQIHDAATESKADKTDTTLDTTLSRGRVANKPIGQASFAFGVGVEASETAAHAEGYSSSARGIASHAEGSGTDAVGIGSHAEGTATVATGQSSHAEGRLTVASGRNSHAGGDGTRANGKNATAIGRLNVISTLYPEWVSGTSYEIGDKILDSNGDGYECIEANSDDEFVLSKWKLLDSTGDEAFVIGNGVINNDIAYRSNALRVDWDGNEYLSGDLYIGCNDDSTGGGRVPSETQVNALIASAMSGFNPFNAIIVNELPQIGQSGTLYLLQKQGTAPDVYDEYMYINSAWELIGSTEIDISGKADKADTVLDTTLSRGRVENSTVGAASFAFGTVVIASAPNAHAEGSSTIASNNQAHAEGGGTVASGANSHAEGASTTASGSNAHSEGAGTTASGYQSHSEGAATVASGMQSHAEGSSTRAIGDNSHAEGNGTTSTYYHKKVVVEGVITDTSELLDSGAVGHVSHSEGLGTRAYGTMSHSEGEWTNAEGPISHAEGYQTYAAQYSHAEGDNTSANGIASHAEGSNNVAANDYSHAEGLQTKATGGASHSEGYRTSATGSYSHAEGTGSTASGQGSHAEGQNTSASGEQSHSEGTYTVAAGARSHAEGTGSASNTVYSKKIYRRSDGITTSTFSAIPGAYGSSAHVEGYMTRSDGSTAHAEGSVTYANSANSHAEGQGTYADGPGAHAEGVGTTANSSGGHAEGYETYASGYGAHAEGYGTVAAVGGAHAEGYNTKALDDYSHAEGLSTIADANYAHAEGYSTNSHGDAAHTEGWETEASHPGAHAEGHNTLASAQDAHAEGNSSTASGTFAHAEGYTTTASGYASHAEGHGTVANGDDAHVSGRYNVADSNNWPAWVSGTAYAVGDKVKYTNSQYVNPIAYVCITANSDATFDSSKWKALNNRMHYVTIVGNGDDDQSRSNAYALDWEGNAHFAGDVYTGANADSTGGTKLPNETRVNAMIQAAISGAGAFDVEIVQTLPQTGNTNTIYMVPKQGASGDAYNEYLYISNAWELIGSTDIDISSKADKADTVLDTTLSRGRKENTTVGMGSLAFGVNVEASGNYSHAEGRLTVSSGNYSHAEGSGTIASGTYSHAEGSGTIALGMSSHVSGVYNAEDLFTTWPEWVSGTEYAAKDLVKVTTIENGVTTVNGYRCGVANSDTVFDLTKWTLYNDQKRSYAEIVGNGYQTLDPQTYELVDVRSNAYALDWEGNGHFAGDIYVGCNPDSTGGSKLATTNYVDNKMVVASISETRDIINGYGGV